MSRFRAWTVDQPLLRPPSVSEFVMPGHLCLLVRDLERTVLHLGGILRSGGKDTRGNPPYHPAMLVDQIEEHLGAPPREVSADSNYWPEENLEGL